MCCYSPHIRLKFGEIRFLIQGFITEKPLVGHFFPKFRGPLAQKLWAGSQNNRLWKMVQMFFVQMPSVVEIDLRTATREG